MNKALVTIVGQPNVGKSTFFNRIIERREAIVDDFSGVTRDRKYAAAEWCGVEFNLVDTGGYFPGADDKIGKAILKQVDASIKEADVVIYMVDGRKGLTPMDEDIAAILKKWGKPIVLCVNKLDSAELDVNSNEFYRLGLGEPFPIASSNGRNIGDFLDVIIEHIPDHKRQKHESDNFQENRMRLAIVGKPNAGKSSLINALLGEEKHIVTDIAGTTRDSVDTLFKYHGEEIILVDTAGLRRRSKVVDRLEYYSTVRTQDAIRRCDVAVVMIDATEGLVDQDIRIILDVVKFNKGVIIAVNKWDLIEKDTKTAQEFERAIKELLNSLRYIPAIFISALTKQRIYKVIDMAKELFVERQRKISTSDLNRFLEEITAKYPPPSNDKKEIKIKYITQVKSPPPVFALYANHPTSIKANYRQYIENQLRERFPFTGVPLTFVFKKK
ncbi:MAG: ribosome biogenesis GTPase Der [Deferribacteres bacterium]|nr:ribosome biogenesis GTPase Der [candidate division KSB1 bacterium]MCB9501502.1 ribosome biogenesis GTPase Der [Deferribacteres bacterium]